MTNEELRAVAEDLQYLRDGWGPDIPDPDIRRGSAVLRRLLVENVYIRAWRATGLEGQPTVVAIDLSIMVSEELQEKIVSVLALGAEFRGVYMALPCQMIGNARLPSPSLPLSEHGYPGERVFMISKYLESLSGISQGIKLKRREVIKYIANVKGGVHLGRKGKAEEKALVRKGEKFEKELTVETTDGLLVELVSIAQAIGRSDDAEKFISRVIG